MFALSVYPIPNRRGLKGFNPAKSIGEPRSLSKPSHGQATVEYVLLLVFVIAIITLAAAQLFTPMREWMKYEMNGYIFCLLDQGKLPRGVGEETTDGGSGCVPPGWKKGTWKDPNKSLSSSEKGRTSSSEEDDSQHSKKGKKEKNKDLSSKGGGAGSGTREPQISLPPSIQHSSGGVDSKFVGGDGEGIPLSESQKKSLGFQKYASSTMENQTISSSKDGFLINASILPTRDRSRLEQGHKKTPIGWTSEDSGAGGKNKKFLLPTPKPKSAPPTDEESMGWGLGKIFRWLIILAIIIALVLFVAQQLNQIRKSREK